MKPIKIYKPFSVLVVPFPFTDSSQKKRRPALVVSSKTYQKETDHISLLMITSSLHSPWYGDYLLTELKTTGLTSKSIVRQKIFTIDMRLIINEIGMLSEKDKQEVSKKLHDHLFNGKF